MDFQEDFLEDCRQFFDEPNVDEFMADSLKTALDVVPSSFPYCLELDSPYFLESAPSPVPLPSAWSSWGELPFQYGVKTDTFSSTGSTEDQHPGPVSQLLISVRQQQQKSTSVLLPAAEFIFRKGEGTETLAERVGQSLPTVPSVTVTSGCEAKSSLEAAIRNYRKHQKHKEIEERRIVVKAVKRKVAEVDLDSISDPEERKKQRRMAKNRRTAAVSRLRQKARVDNLETTIQDLEKENESLKTLLSHFLPLEELHGKTNICTHLDELAVLLTGIYLATLQSSALQMFLLVMKIFLAQSITINFSPFSFLSIAVQAVRKTQHYSQYDTGLAMRSGVS